jgi:mannose-1-phosphate guanylyltransferase/mannose-6-phosphate isomerase
MAAIEIQPVILSGGSGTRLWPLSREAHPKPLLRLFGEHSLLQQTALRVDGPPPIVVCNEEHRFISAEQLQEVGRAPRAVILEPEGRNTAPALAVAALEAARGGADPVLLGHAGGPPDPQARRFPQGGARRGGACSEGRLRRVRRQARSRRDRLRLHPAQGRGGGLRREARRGARRKFVASGKYS